MTSPIVSTATVLLDAANKGPGLDDLRAAINLNKASDLADKLHGDEKEVPAPRQTTTLQKIKNFYGNAGKYVYPTIIVLPLIVAVIVVLAAQMKMAVKCALVVLLLIALILYFMQTKGRM